MSAPIFNLVSEYTDATNPDSLSTAPHWIIAVVRLPLPLSFSRKEMGSVSKHPADGVSPNRPTLVITTDCVQLTISGTKESHLKSLGAQLMPGRFNYLTEILPGDWVLAWIVDGSERADDIVQRIKNGRACNGFKDGFKFVGRAQSIRKSMTLNRASGVKSVSFTLQAAAFRELDTSLFYDQNLAESDETNGSIGTWLAKVGIDIREFFRLSATSGKLEDNVHKLIPEFLDLLLGRGVASTINPTGKDQLRASYGPITKSEFDRSNSDEAPFAYLVPKEVGDLLGKSSRDASKAGGILAYTDILESITGIQTYSNTGSTSEPYRGFIPDYDSSSTPQRKFTGTPMMGAFLPLMPPFTNRPLWGLLQQFLNGTVNEMFTAIRVNDQGNVVPTLVVRQIPFTTDAFAAKNTGSLTTKEFGPMTKEDDQKIPITRFLSLPRWVMDKSMVNDINFGRSDATHCNFVHIFGQAAYTSSNISITEQLVQNPPVRDDLDIQRSGLRSYMTTVACSEINSIGNVPRKWMEFVADIMVGSQFTLNGSMSSLGISAPICEGDNLEFDGIVFHIESFSHNCMQSPQGRRSFTTQLTLTNGMRSDTGPRPKDNTGNDEFPMYPGIDPTDSTRFDPGYTSEQPTPDLDESPFVPPDNDDVKD